MARRFFCPRVYYGGSSSPWAAEIRTAGRSGMLWRAWSFMAGTSRTGRKRESGSLSGRIAGKPGEQLLEGRRQENRTAIFESERNRTGLICFGGIIQGKAEKALKMRKNGIKQKRQSERDRKEKPPRRAALFKNGSYNFKVDMLENQRAAVVIIAGDSALDGRPVSRIAAFSVVLMRYNALAYLVRMALAELGKLFPRDSNHSENPLLYFRLMSGILANIQKTCGRFRRPLQTVSAWTASTCAGLRTARGLGCKPCCRCPD